MLISLNDVNAYPKEDLEGKDNHRQEFEDLPWASFGQLQENDRAPQKEALKKIQEIFGIRNQSESLAHHKIPQFMMELYNTVTDSNEDTQVQNPYNAKVVRSFIENDTSLPNFYFFNISGLETKESVLEAELHLYRKKMENLPGESLYSFYQIKLYQVLNDNSLDTPDLHRLLTVYYVDAHASGWKVFNVTQAVLGWLSGEPNLGLLVTVSNMFDNEELVEFFHRNDYHHNKQPILVLFDDVESDRSRKLSYYAYENQDEEDDEKVAEDSEKEQKEKEKENEINLEDNNAEYYTTFKRLRKDGQPEEVLLMPNLYRREQEFFQRQKRRREKKNEKRGMNEPAFYNSQGSGILTSRMMMMTGRHRRDVTSPKKRTAKIVSKNHTKKVPKVLTSMDIYARTEFRERINQKMRNQSITRQRRSADNQTIPVQSNTVETCTRHELYVDFQNIGLSSIIAPPGYDAYQCKGVCESPISQDQLPTNHATIQAIVNKVGLVKDVGKPCCVPIKLKSISILFLDNESSVVLKNYEDMVVERCGCR